MNWKDKRINNPWADISYNNIFADGDYGYLVNIDKKSNLQYQFGSPSYVEAIKKLYSESKLSFSCLPSPYSGNPDANVYCLNMNPGEPDSHFDKLTPNLYTTHSLDNLNHQVQDTFWTEGMVVDKQGNVKKDNVIFEKLLKDEKAVPGYYIHSGARWQRARTKELRDALNGRNPNIFFLEYFPYHSEHGFEFPKYLPSYDYRNALLQFAMDEGKLIIIMRSENAWYKIKDVGEALRDYKKKIFLRCSQGGWLTRSNMAQVIPDNQSDIMIWDDILRII